MVLKEWQVDHVVAHTYLANEAHFHVIWQSALGMNIRFYRPLAEALVHQGISVTLLEQRGHGHSPIRSSKNQQFGIEDLLDDVGVLYSVLKKTYPHHQFVLAGHSLGGHLSILFAANRINLPVLTVACALPFYQWFSFTVSLKIFFLVGMIKLLTPLLGYYPGNKLGFGGRENATLMGEWAGWALNGHYGESYRDACQLWQGNLKAIDIVDDAMAPGSAAVKIRQLLPAATIERTSFAMVERNIGNEHSHWCRGKNLPAFAELFKRTINSFEHFD